MQIAHFEGRHTLEAGGHVQRHAYRSGDFALYQVVGLVATLERAVDNLMHDLAQIGGQRRQIQRISDIARQ